MFNISCCAQCLCPCIFLSTCAAFPLMPGNKPRFVFLLRLHLLWEADCKISAKKTWQNQSQERHNWDPSATVLWGITKDVVCFICMYSVCTEQSCTREAFIPGHCWQKNIGQRYFKSGEQAILAAAAAEQDSGGKGFQDHRVLRVECFCETQLFMWAGPGHRTNALCEKHTS